MSEGSITSVGAAAILGLASWIGNEWSRGGIIHILGGVAKSDVEKMASAGVTSGAVVAFDLSDGCPKGWTQFKPATARVIVGAGDQFEAGYEADESGTHLTTRNYLNYRGSEHVLITMDNLPKYNFTVGTRVVQVQGGNFANIRHLDGKDPFLIGSIGPSNGQTVPIPTMPPFIPLYYCKKNQ